MKNLLLLMMLLFSIGIFAQDGRKNEKVVIKTNIYCDHCKECPSCGKGMKTELLRIKGVKMFELDDKKMTLTVYYNAQKTDASQIRKAISELGYDADEVKAVPAAYEKLDECCKKA